MLKKVLVMGMTTVGALSLFWAKAESHLIYSAGRWLTHSSIICEQVIDRVRNPDVHVALSECAISASLIEVLCVNPNGKEVTGTAATQITMIQQEPFSLDHQPSKKDKQKNKVHLNILVEDAEALFNPQFCVGGTGGGAGGNASQWTVTRVEILEFVAAGNLFECTGPKDNPCSSSVLSSTIQANCALPLPFSVMNPPPEGIEYDCDTTEIEHVGH